MFDVKQYIKIFILHSTLGTPFSLSLSPLQIVDPMSFESANDDGEQFAAIVTGTYIVREIDMRGESRKVLSERPGTNPVVGWDWYVDRVGRSRVF